MTEGKFHPFQAVINDEKASEKCIVDMSLDNSLVYALLHTYSQKFCSDPDKFKEFIESERSEG